MRYPVNLALFEGTKHSPTLPALQRSMGTSELKLRDYCIPVNPYFPAPGMMEAFQKQLPELLKYYPDAADSVAGDLADALHLPLEGMVIANGSTELITWIDHLLVKESLATPIPTFGRWTDQPLETGKILHPYPLQPHDDYRLRVPDFLRYVRETDARAVAVCNPNNPTGNLLSDEEISELIDGLRHLDLVVIDESFLDFAREERIPTAAHAAFGSHNTIVLKSLGKNFGLHGLRAGYAVANPTLAKRLRDALPKWNVNGLAIELIRLFPSHRLAYEASRRQVVRDRMRFGRKLCSLDFLKVYESGANFHYVLLEGVEGKELRNRLLVEYGIFLRECGNKVGSTSQHFRIATRPAAEQDYLLNALKELGEEVVRSTVPSFVTLV